MLLAAAIVWPHVPEQIPTHWNIQGQPDGYSGKLFGLLIFPALAFGLYLLLMFAPRLDPGYRNYQNFAGTYLAIRVSVLCFMVAVDGIIVLGALGRPVDVNAGTCVAVGVLFVILGNFMGKIRPNWFAGVRTPWTLSSKTSWNKTHRQAGWLFIAMGVLIGVAGFVQTVWMFALTGVFFIGCMVWLVVYSYLVYRTANDHTSPAGTSPASE
jgi:uncharacterized membrane protein